MARRRRGLDTGPSRSRWRTRQALRRIEKTQDREPSISVEDPDVQRAAGHVAGRLAWSVEVRIVGRGLSWCPAPGVRDHELGPLRQGDTWRVRTRSADWIGCGRLMRRRMTRDLSLEDDEAA